MRQAKPPTPSSDLVDHIIAVSQKPKFTGRQIVGALRVSDVAPWQHEDMARLLDVLRVIDGDWLVRLAIIERGLPSRRSEFTRLLHEALIAESRTQSAFPPAPLASEDHERVYTEWAINAVTGAPGSMPAALVLVALWPDRGAAWFPQSALLMLNAWGKAPRQQKKDSVWLIVARLIGNPRLGQRRAGEVASLLAPAIGRREKAVLASRQSAEAAERAKEARLQAEIDLGRTRLALEAAVSDVNSAAEREAELRKNLTDAAANAENEMAASKTRSSNEVARFRAKTVQVLRHETEQIRLFLDRPSPNIGDALARLRHLEDLQSELQKEGQR